MKKTITRKSKMNIDFKKSNGLVPVIAQEYGTNKVLMLNKGENDNE